MPKAFAQDPYANRVILAHYDTTALDWMQANDMTRYNTVVYYYTQSFIVESISCDGCGASKLSDFDVSKYEYLREKNTRFIRSFPKEGFKLTLLSMSELTYKMPIHIIKLTQ